MNDDISAKITDIEKILNQREIRKKEDKIEHEDKMVSFMSLLAREYETYIKIEEVMKRNDKSVPIFKNKHEKFREVNDMSKINEKIKKIVETTHNIPILLSATPMSNDDDIPGLINQTINVDDNFTNKKD